MKDSHSIGQSKAHNPPISILRKLYLSLNQCQI